VARRWLALVAVLSIAVLVPQSGWSAQASSTGPLPALLASIPIPDFPQFLAIDPSINRIYVTHAGSNEVAVVDAVSRSVVATIPLGDAVTGVAADPTTHRVYAANFFHNTISVIDEATNSIVGHVDISSAAIGFGGGTPLLLAANPNTQRIYVALGGGSVAVIDETTDAVVGKIVTGGTPTGIAVNPITNRIYAADQGLERVFVIDGATNALIATVVVPQRAGGGDVSVNTVENRAYAISADSAQISVIDGATNTLVGTIDRCCFGGTAFDAASDRLYASNLATHSIDVYDGASDALLGSVPVDATPLFGVGFNPTLQELYATAASFAGGYALLVLGNADTTPPRLTVSVTPSVLWPPNHLLVPIVVSVSATDESGIASVILVSVTSNELDDGLGDGDTSGDIQGAPLGTGGTHFSLRAERSGTGQGRTYTITYRATDNAGNVTTASATVSVPISQAP